MELKIIIAYQTSKGLFHSLDEAKKKKNLSYDGRDCVYEEPVAIHVLTDGNMFFLLTPITFKQ